MTEKLELRLMSYNVWNYNDPWPQRRKIIVDTILEQDPDIIGLQEIRDDRKFNPIGQNQASQIASRTGLDYHYQPAMVYSRSPRSVEGLCVMARHPMESTAYVELTRNPQDQKDFHQRIVLNATLALPSGSLEFFVTHFSLSPEMRVCNSLELLQFMQNFNSGLPKFVVGDFNATPDEDAMRILTGGERLPDQSVIGNFVDLWDEAPAERRKSATRGPFSHGDRRIDYIFMVPCPWARVTVKDVAFLDARDSSGLAGSDHAAVVADVSISVQT